MVSFKVCVEDSRYRAFCNESTCAWGRSATGRKRGGSAANDAAREHTRLTGHETRIDATHQRGFRRL